MFFNLNFETSSRFAPLLLVLFLAFSVPILLGRFRRVPVVVGEIIAGIIIGPYIKEWITDGSILTFMSDVGLAFLMFLAGMEIDFKLIFPRQNGIAKGKEPGITQLAFWGYLATLVLALPAAFLIRWTGLEVDTWLLVFVLSATSLGILLPILKERNLLQHRFGQLLFVSAMLADFVTVIMLTVYLILSSDGFNLHIFSVGLLFLAFGLLYQLTPIFSRLEVVKDFFEEFSRSTVQIKVRGAILLLMAFVVLAEYVEAELILGAFLGGMVISLMTSPEDEGLIHKLEAFGFGFFIPVFFIMAGASLDLGALMTAPENLWSLIPLFGFSLLIKVAPMFLFRKIFSWRNLLGGGLLLNTHLSLEIAIAIVGLRTGLISPAASTTIILFAVLTVLTMPLLCIGLLPLVQEKEKTPILLLRVGLSGIQVAEQLRAHGDLVYIADDDADSLQKAQEAGFQVFPVSNLHSLFEKLPPNQFKTALVLSENDQLNLETSREVRKLGIQHVIALVKEPGLLSNFQRAGVKPFTPAIQRATMISIMARNPDVLTLLTSTSDARDIRELSLQNPALAGKSMRDLALPGDILVLAIRRNGEMILPRGSTTLEMADRLTILGDLTILDGVQAWLEGTIAQLDKQNLV